MSMISMVVGGTTDTSARFVAKVDNGPVRIAYDTSPAFTDPTTSASEAVDADGVATVEVTGLSAGTRYHWRVVDNGVRDDSATGQVLTHPAAAGAAGSYVMAASGDSGLSPLLPGDAGGELDAARVSNHPIFDLVRSRGVAGDWLYHVNLGDWGYPDWGSRNTDSVTNRRRFMDDQLAQSNQAALRQQLAHVDVWDDHDFAANDSDGSYVDKANAAQIHRERLPNHDLAEVSGPIYRSFPVCRVLHVVFDTRYERDPLASPPTMLGATQKSWLDTLLQGTSAEALVAWMPTPWMSNAAGDTWGGFQTERDEVRDIFGDNGFLSRMMMLHADVHAVGVAAGASNEHGGFPVLCCAALDASASTLSGPSFDFFRGARGQYASLRVDDLGGDVVLTGTVWRGSTPLAWTSLSTGGATAIGGGNPSHVLAL